MENILAIYKPKGPTSHDIINQLRKITGIRKIGHAGTLDPLASGVLVVAIGRDGTKQLGSLLKNEKEYIAEIKLGETSTTDDAEGVKRKYTNIKYYSNLNGESFSLRSKNKIMNVTKKDIEKILGKFIGHIRQVPPVYSAIKINGKSACRRVRKGENIKLEAREVLIKSIKIIEYKYPILKINIDCGSGVYIRSLARDIGEALGTGAYLSNLERTRVGKYDKINSIDIETFKSKWDNRKD